MEFAAEAGHLKIVKFFFEAFGWSCSVSAFGKIATRDHLEVVKFVHENCAEWCTTQAADGAARQGHLEVVKFLHFNRSEGCTATALQSAAASGHVDIVHFLCEHRSEGDVLSALREAALHSRLEAVKALHGHLKTGESAYHAVEIAAQACNGSPIVKFLCEHQGRKPTTFLKQAIANGASRVVQGVTPYSSLEELNASDEYALEMENPEIAALITQRIQAKRIH